MTVSIGDRTADTWDSARAYFAAVDQLEGATGDTARTLELRRDSAWHDLALSVRGVCKVCDEGTCEGFVNA